ncbi:MAG TPA: RHS repeat-associated core domain-containing protein [Candidatus Angelobacter sp.]
MGRLSTETRTLTGANNAAISKGLSYEYNLSGSLTKLHYPSDAVVTYTPDAAGHILSAVDSGNSINYITGSTYGPDGGPTGFVSGNSATFAGITNAFSYNKRLQPVTMSATSPSQTVYSIGYDFHAGNGTTGSGANNGNVFGITNYKDTTHGRDQTFTYDPLNRVTSAQNTGTDCNAMTVNNKIEYWGNSYSYDAWGNLLQKSITKCGAENFLVTADAHNWIHASGTDYQYDAAGNMTYDATAALNYTFDQENRLTGSAGYTYTYDGDGNRVRKSNGNLAANGTLYWYMSPGVVPETDLAGTTKSEYIFFDGERMARRDGATGTGGVFYYFSDRLKTASVITDSAGTIKAVSDYYPWGGELQFINNDSNDYKFTGKKRDLETGLDYFGARYYSNALGRWVSADWSSTAIPVPYANFADPQTLNLYNFVGGNPASKADPNGHATELPDMHQNLLDLSQLQIPLRDITVHGMPICICQGAQNQSMSLSPKGLEFIERHAGYSSTVYDDSAGNPTIGYGHLIKAGEDFSKGITKEKAGELLSQDSKTAVDAVNGKITAKLSQAKFDAVVDFTYNLGGGNLGKSTLLKNINAGKNVTEGNFTDWNRAGGKVVNGLTIRRTDEWSLFSKGDYGGP